MQAIKEIIYGKKHQAFKAKVAMGSSNRLDTQIKTFKVRLDADISDQAKDLQFLHSIVEGTEENSLYRYVLTLKTLGFSFRSSAGLVNLDGSLSGEPNKQFLTSLESIIKDGSIPNAFNLVAVYKTLTTTKRKPETFEFSIEEIVKHFILRFGGKNFEDAATEFEEFVVSFSKAVLEQAKDWTEFNELVAKKELLSIFDSVVNSFNPVKKTLISSISVSEHPAKKSSVFYNSDYALSDIDADTKIGDKDYLLHCATALAMMDGSENILSSPKEASSCAKSHLTTSTANALSWLLGNGLKYFKSQDAAVIASDYGCPIEVANKVKELVANIPVNHALGKGYAGFRTSLSGQIDSWISNYYNRLYSIESVLTGKVIDSITLPESLAEKQADYFFNFMPLGYKDLSMLLEKSKKDSEAISKELAILIGKEVAPKGFDVLDAIQRLDSFQESLVALTGMLNQLHNRIKQEIEIAEKTNRPDDAVFAKKCSFAMASFDFDKILQRKVEQIDFESDLEQKASDILSLTLKSLSDLSKILEETKSFKSPLSMRQEREHSHLSRSKNSDEKPELMAKRHLWSYVLKNIRNLSEPTKAKAIELLKELKLFTPPSVIAKKNPYSTLNKMMYNNQGDVYYSLFSRNRNKPYDINLKLDPYAESLELLNALEKNAIQYLTKENSNQEKEVYLKDWVMLKRMRFNLELDRLPKELPSKLILETGIAETESFPVQFKQALNASDTIGGDLARKSLNHYISLISRAMSFVFRDSFSIKMGFSIDKDIGMVWKAKDKPWTLPKTAVDNSGLMALSEDGLTIESSALTGKEPEIVYRNFPHEIYVPTPFVTTTKMQEGDTYFFAEKKGGLKTVKKKDFMSRVVAKSSWRKYFLDAILRDDAELSRPSFLFEGRVKQSIDVDLDKDGGIAKVNLSLTEPEWITYLAQPINFHPSCLTNGEVLSIFERAVAIDLGEVGVGYCVFDAKTQEVITSGTKRLPSLAKLPKMVRKGRKNRQPRQGYKQVFSTKLMDARAHAVGELKFFIDNLMNEYGAFPIFESAVPNLQSGSREIETVYKNLMQYYTFSNISAHKSERKSNWLSGDKWEHPFLEVTEKVEKKGKFVIKTDKKGNPVYKTLNLFPGTVVNPAGTSQVCSCCGVNPIQEIRDHFAKIDDKTLFVDSNGEFTVGEHIFIVEKRFTFDDLPEAEAKDLHRRNRRSPWGKKYRAGQYSENELLKMVRMHMRRPHDNLRSKDTSQSQYHCLKKGCQSNMHADENAAFNIGRKWFKTTRLKED